jgi:hypothetical protein
MNTATFTVYRNLLNKHCEDLLKVKEQEYADGTEDRLIQFKLAAALQQTTPIKALLGMMVKHETSIHSMGSVSFDMWKEKLGDLRNYVDLLWALVHEAKEVDNATRDM